MSYNGLSMEKSDFSSVYTRNNVKISGNGKETLMFGHGFGCDQNTWRLVAPAFEEHFKIVLFDYVGAGNSELAAYDDERYGKLEGYAQDLIDIYQGLGLTDITFIGHSVSSMIGLLALKKCPEIFKKIIFIGPSPRYINGPDYPGGIEETDLYDLLEVMDSNYLGWSRTLAPKIMGNPDQPHLGTALADSFCATNPDIARKFARVTFLSDNRKDLAYLKIPSLTIQCNDDFLTSRDVAKYIHENTISNSMVFLESSGHCPHLSAPEEVIKAIKVFLQ
jgi:sigma-B regulation protein RsbQ